MAEFNIGEAWGSFHDLLNQNLVPEICLLAMGLLTLLMVYTYRKDDESPLYRALVILGVAFGIFMAYVSALAETGWAVGTQVICVLVCFTLIIRPFRKVRMELIIGLVVLIWSYIYFGTLNGVHVDWVIHMDLTFLSHGVLRFLAALIAGSAAYSISMFATDAASLVGKVLNAWPFLSILAIWCILESIVLFAGYPSITDFVMSMFQ